MFFVGCHALLHCSIRATTNLFAKVGGAGRGSHAMPRLGRGGGGRSRDRFFFFRETRRDQKMEDELWLIPSNMVQLLPNVHIV